MKTNSLRGMKKMLVGGLLAALALLAMGCSSAVDDAAGIPVPPEARKATVSGNLAPGDVISIVYPGATELNLTQKIRPNGRVSLPIIGDVQAAGKSVASFQSYLLGRYKEELQESTVVVSLDSVAAAAYVSGSVNSPGKIPLDRPMTALQAVMESGGFSPLADLKKGSVVRTAGGTHQRYNINFADAMVGKAPAFYLKPFDVVYVGQRTW